jgi:hypothetical protein
VLLEILYFLIPGVLILGTLGLIVWVAKRRLIDRKPASSASQLLAQQTLMDLKTDQGRQALVEQIGMKERPAADADGETDGDDQGADRGDPDRRSRRT